MKPGRLFAVVGASGAGKDSLLQAARRHRPDLHFVRRVITRPAAAGGEEFDGVSPAEFDARLARGDFALHWAAHGLRYGVPTTVRAVLASGRDAVFNGSRENLPEAQAAFPELVVLHITAETRLLADRLATRGRERAEDLPARLARAALPLPDGLANVVEIDNSGHFEDALAAFLAALDSAGGQD